MAPPTGRQLPSAALIEIVDHGHTTDDTPGGSLILPDQVRINGQPLLVEDGSVRIHEMVFGKNEVARVTLTLFARRIIVAADGDL